MHFVFGTAMHEAIQHYLQTLFDKSAKEADDINLNQFFKGKMIEEYSKYKKKHGHFATSEELQEFYLDGEAILDWFKKHKRGRRNYFSKRKQLLKGIPCTSWCGGSHGGPTHSQICLHVGRVREFL